MEYARFEEKLKECKRAAAYLKILLERDIKPRCAPKFCSLTTECGVPITAAFCSDILTRNSFLNAIAIVNILGGSTNAVIDAFVPSRAYTEKC